MFIKYSDKKNFVCEEEIVEYILLIFFCIKYQFFFTYASEFLTNGADSGSFGSERYGNVSQNWLPNCFLFL